VVTLGLALCDIDVQEDELKTVAVSNSIWRSDGNARAATFQEFEMN